MASADELKAIACEAIDKHSEKLHLLSQSIWKNPELGYQEHHAHKVLTEFLEKAGFPGVQKSYVLDTGFKAEYGDSDGPSVAVLCEYDALPEIGHACGHNLIAEAGVGAAIGIKAAMDAAKDRGQTLGKVGHLGNWH